ncbi:putative OsmC-like protein [Pseudogracilibacillus auburnensis]|uniref:Putative OsmC-like protein n=2 Tax=Pseudogracilibacillus auburnensis TaxID=1494959 RepID=A0A2V3VUN0_9BACI|nr:putative OsmC-like protein [Pseudogracilibacillus auburnensis]
MQMSSTTNTLIKMAAKGKWDGGIKSSNTIRHFESFKMDEPVKLGGQDTGGTPLEYIAAALNGCKAVMIPLIAKEQNFTFSSIDFETDGYVDIRGLLGEEGVKTYFQKILFSVEIETDESDEALERLKAEVERRCPVYNLFVDAGISVEVDWKKK